MARHYERTIEAPEKGCIAGTFALVIAIVAAALAALAASVVLEWAGVAAGWWDVDHAWRMLATERGYIEALDHYPLLVLQPVDVSNWAAGCIDDGLQRTGMSDTAGIYLSAMVNTLKLVALRTTFSLFALPGYLLVATAAFFEGLVARDIRKFSGGHESSYVFHKAKRWITPTVILTVTVYLMLPFSVPPAVIFAPTMLFAGAMVYIATSRFKKFV